MPSFTTLKHSAREALHGSWGKAILILLIGEAVGWMLFALQVSTTNLLTAPVSPSAYSDVNEYFYQNLANAQAMDSVVFLAFTLLGLLLQAPLSLGMKYWYWALGGRKTAAIPEVFRNFESGTRYRRAVWLEVNLGVRGLLWAIPFFIVPLGMYIVSFQAMLAADQAGVPQILAAGATGMLITLILFLLAVLFYSVFLNRYFLAAYLLCGDGRLSVRKAIKLSVAYTKGHRFSLLGFQLSFILWFLLSLFIFPLLFTIPYYAAANAQYARSLIEKNRAGYPADPTQEFTLENREPKEGTP